MSLVQASLTSPIKHQQQQQPPAVVFTTTYHRVLLCEQIVREVVVSSSNGDQQQNSSGVTYDSSNRVRVQQEYHQQRHDILTTNIVNGSSEDTINRIPVPVLSPDYIKKFQNKKVGKKKQIAWTDERKAVSVTCFYLTSLHYTNARSPSLFMYITYEVCFFLSATELKGFS